MDYSICTNKLPAKMVNLLLIISVLFESSKNINSATSPSLSSFSLLTRSIPPSLSLSLSTHTIFTASTPSAVATDPYSIFLTKKKKKNPKDSFSLHIHRHLHLLLLRDFLLFSPFSPLNALLSSSLSCIFM